jgi:hypothetical protein
MTDDQTPDGDPVETHTVWLPFAEGEVAISIDLTRWNAAMRRLREIALDAAAEEDADHPDYDENWRP